MLLVLPLVAQSPGVPGTPLHLQSQTMKEFPYEPPMTPNEQMNAHRIAQLNTLRQKAMVSDAEKLLRLARELNADANAGGTILSLPEKMRKAAEIEKLAKNVKDKMTYTVGDPSLLAPFPVMQR